MAISLARRWTRRRPSRTSSDAPSRPRISASRSRSSRAKTTSTLACMITVLASAGTGDRFAVPLLRAPFARVFAVFDVRAPAARVVTTAMYTVCHTQAHLSTPGSGRPSAGLDDNPSRSRRGHPSGEAVEFLILDAFEPGVDLGAGEEDDAVLGAVAVA